MNYMRENLKDTFKILRLQEKILQIAVYIDELCIQHNISYYLMGGSALGAVRHGGFIPWDDDLDIFMTPNNYEKFRNVFFQKGDKDNYYLQQLTLRDNMVASAKIRLNNTTYIEEATKDLDIHQGIFVDIFILHNCPEHVFLQFLQLIAAKYILIKGQSFKNARYSGLKGIIIRLFKLMPKNLGVKAALKLLYYFNSKKTKYTCHFMGKAFYKKGIYDAKYFGKGKRVKFENVILNAPSDIDGYLKKRFGDYMTLPSIESIKQAQHAWKWDVNKDFSLYVGDNDRSQEKYLV